MMKKVWSDVKVEELDVNMTLGGFDAGTDEEMLIEIHPDWFTTNPLNGVINPTGEHMEDYLVAPSSWS